MEKMKKSEYYAKKYFVAYHDDDADELAQTLDTIGEISRTNKELADELSTEIQKINNEMLRFENDSNREEKIEKLMERYRKEIEMADKDRIS